MFARDIDMFLLTRLCKQASSTSSGLLLRCVSLVTTCCLNLNSCRGVEAEDTVEGDILGSVIFTCSFHRAGSDPVRGVCNADLHPCKDSRVLWAAQLQDRMAHASDGEVDQVHCVC